MVRKLIDWAVANPFLVVLAALALASVGGYAFVNVNVEAYPDPAPAIIEVVAQYPGASAEEVERLDKISEQPLPYPFWHHLNARDRLSPADLTLLDRHLNA